MRKLTHDEFLQRLDAKKLEEYQILGKYDGGTNKILILHNKCGRMFEVRPANFIQGTGCSLCYRKTKSNTDEFKKRVKDLTGNEYKVLGEYTNSRTKIEIKHSKCRG